MVGNHLMRLRIFFSATFILSLVLGIGVFLKAGPAKAQVPGYDISISANSTNMYYGQGTPSYRIQLTVPADDPLSNPLNFWVNIDGKDSNGGSPNASNPPTSYSFYFGGLYTSSPLSVGQHSVTAVYYSLKLKTTIVSDPFPLNVLKMNTDLSCYVENLAYTYGINSPITIKAQIDNTNTTVDMLTTTFTIKFVGPQTYTTANIVPNSAGEMTVNAPPVVGAYQLQCLFDGSDSYNSSGFYLSALVSEQIQPGKISLYTNPTTVVSGQATTWYITVTGVPGHPAPTGDINISNGYSYLRPIPLGSDGTLLFQVNAPNPLTGTTIGVFFFGDVVYASASATFSLTNPAIPANVGNTPPPTNTPTPVPTPTTAASTATPVPVATATPVPAATATLVPTAVPAATATSVPTTVPVATPTSGAVAVATTIPIATPTSVSQPTVVATSKSAPTPTIHPIATTTATSKPTPVFNPTATAPTSGAVAAVPTVTVTPTTLHSSFVGNSAGGVTKVESSGTQGNPLWWIILGLLLLLAAGSAGALAIINRRARTVSVAANT